MADVGKQQDVEEVSEIAHLTCQSSKPVTFSKSGDS